MPNTSNTRTGRFGALQVTVGGVTAEVGRTTQWAVNPTLATSSEWGDSDSGGFTNRTPGRLDATFTCEGKYTTATSGNPRNAYDLFQPGDYAAPAILWLDGAVAALHWDFIRALCNDFNLTIDITAAEVIGWTAAFGADGAYVRPGGTVDSTIATASTTSVPKNTPGTVY